MVLIVAATSRARMRHHRRRLVVMRPGLAVEAVIDAGIDVDLDLGAPREGLLDLLDRRHRDILVLLGEMHDDRAFDARREVERLLDPDPVIADGAIDARLGRGEIGELAAEAEAERADLSGALPQSAQRLHRRGDVPHPLGDVEFLVELEGLLPIRLGLPELDILLDPPEEIRAEHDVTLGGIEIGDVAHVLVDAEDLLDEDEAGPFLGLRQGEIGPETIAVGRRDLDEFPHRAAPRLGDSRIIFRA
jgi:hypothetical protein